MIAILLQIIKDNIIAYHIPPSKCQGAINITLYKGMI